MTQLDTSQPQAARKGRVAVLAASVAILLFGGLIAKGYYDERKLQEAMRRVTEQAASSEAGSGEGRVRATLADYDRVQPGMLASDLDRIIGTGKEAARTEIPTIDGGRSVTFVRTWENPDGSSLVVTFQDYRVVSKAQVGLR